MYTSRVQTKLHLQVTIFVATINVVIVYGVYTGHLQRYNSVIVRFLYLAAPTSYGV